SAGVTLEVTPLRHGHDFHRFFLTGKSPIGKEEELMKDWQSLSHVKWDCKFHVVFVSKYRKRATISLKYGLTQSRCSLLSKNTSGGVDLFNINLLESNHR
ncbi:MAG: hypothetical protein LJE96_05280, partial [Deltaproteobacteria bacterium]|nr:hypothetical protein [Deltaproteobacteria bacterium]